MSNKELNLKTAFELILELFEQVISSTSSEADEDNTWNGVCIVSWLCIVSWCLYRVLIFVSCPDSYFPTGPRTREEFPVKQRGKLVVKVEFRKLTIPIWASPLLPPPPPASFPCLCADVSHPSGKNREKIWEEKMTWELSSPDFFLKEGRSSVHRLLLPQPRRGQASRQGSTKGRELDLDIPF